MIRSVSPAPLASSPWRRIDRFGLFATTAVGVVMVATSAFGAAKATAIGTQVGWVNTAVIGVIALGAGNSLWLLKGRRAAGQLRRTVINSAGLARRLAASQRVDRRAVGVAAPVAGKTMTRYHRPDCPLVANKPVSSGSVKTHGRRGRRPCGVCLPDGASLERSDAGA